MLRKIPIVAILTALLAIPCASIFADDYNCEKIVEAKQGTVVIEGDKVDNSRITGTKDYSISYNGVGAGVIVDSRGYIITNYHVIDGIRKILVKTSDKTQYVGQYISHDPVTDIALIKITPEKPLVPLSIGDSSKIQEFTPIAVIGHPFGYTYTIDAGRITGLERQVKVTNDLEYSNLIQISAAINPGNSGGPLLNTQGELIGINSALRQGSNLIAFTIPGDFVLEVGAELLNQYTSQYCYHGIRFKKININLIGTPAISKEDYKIAVVDSVDSGSPAEEAGIQNGDVLISANDILIERKLDFQRAFLELREKQSVKIVFERNGSRYETEMTLRSPRSRTGNIMVASTISPTRASNMNQPVAKSQSTEKSKTEIVAAEYMEYIWNTFGIRVQRVSQSEFNRKNPALSSPYQFEGAVYITDIKQNSIFYKEGLRQNDYLAALITKNDSWNITAPEDLVFIGKHWSPEEMGNMVKMYVVRNQELLYGDVPVTVANNQMKNMK